MSTLEEQIRLIADEAFAQTEPIRPASRTRRAATAAVDTEPVRVAARRGISNRARLLAVAAAVLGIALVGGLLVTANRRADLVPADEPTPAIGEPVTRRFEGVPLRDITVSPGADQIAVARADEICVIATSPDVPVEADRCYSFPSGIGTGSITWSPDATSLVFHHDLFSLGQEPDLVELDLADGEFTVLTDDRVPITGGEGGDTDLAPIFGFDGTLYFFRAGTGDALEYALLEYGSDGEVSATGSVVAGVPGPQGRRIDNGSIVTTFAVDLGATELISVDTDGGPSRSIRFEDSAQAISGAARDRVLLVVPDSSGSFEVSIADFTSGEISPVDLGPLGSSTRVTGAGLSPDGTRVAVIVADQNEADGHELLIVDLADDSSVERVTVLATGSEFAPNDGDKTIGPAGIGRLAEIAWTETSLVYALGPDAIVTLPLR
jgi:hypothetical protein